MIDQNEWDRARAQQRMAKYQIDAGVIQHPATGMWQTWISLGGTDIMLISAHCDRRVAEGVIADLKTAAQMGAVDTSTEVARRFAALHAPSDGEPQPLSKADICAITASIQLAR